MKRFEKILYFLGLVAILFLDYAALDDITTGNEPSLYGEYAILILSIPLVLYLIRKFKKSLEKDI